MKKSARLGLLVLGWVAAANAAPSGADKLAAEALFDTGRKLMGEGKFADACPKFEESNRLDPGVGVLMYLADCHEKSGKPASAWLTWREAAAAARVANQVDREKLALQRASQLEPRLARVQVDVPAASAIAGLAIVRDGLEVNKAIWGVPIPVDPGEHTIEARAPGRKLWTRKFNIDKGAAQVAIQIPTLEIDPQAGAPASASAPAPAASSAPPAPAASSAPLASSAAPAAPRPPAEEGGNKLAASPRALVLGARLGGLVPVGSSGATSSGQSLALSSLYGPGAALEVDAGLKFSPNLMGYAWFSHALLSGGSSTGGESKVKGSDRQALGVALQFSSSDEKKLSVFGEAGVLLYHRFQLREESTGVAGVCSSTTTLSGNAARLGGGVHVPLADGVRLSPFVNAEIGRFVQASYDGTGGCALRSGKYEISSREIHASLLLGASLSYGFGL